MEYPNQMTKQESKKLFIEYKKTGDKEIRDRLIENFLYILNYWSKNTLTAATMWKIFIRLPVWA